MSRRGVVGVRVACRSAAPCRGAILLRTAKRLRAGRRQAQIVLARESFVVRGGRRVTLRLRLPARNRRLVSRLRRTRVVALATIRPAGGEPRLRATARFSVAASR